MSNTPSTNDNFSNPQWDIPNPPFPNAAFGAAFGQNSASGSPQRLINGLTVSGMITVHALAANTQPIFIGDSHVTTSIGFALEAGKDVVLDTRSTRDTWYVVTNGTACTYYYCAYTQNVGG